jgi:RNAse (barnase) inhibitor barstar
MRVAENRVADVQRTLTDAEHVIVKFADKSEEATAYDLEGRWAAKSYDYKIRVVQPSKLWWKSVYKRGLQVVYDKVEAYPLHLEPVDEKARKDGTKLYNCIWYELREKGGPKVFKGFLGTRSVNDGKKLFTSVSEKKTGALMKLTSKIKRWEEMEEKKKNTVIAKELLVEIDETKYKTESELHKKLAELLNFPDYYSESYDELSELIQESVDPIKIRWTARLFSPWLFVDCIRRAAELNNKVTFEIVKYLDTEESELTLDNLLTKE